MKAMTQLKKAVKFQAQADAALEDLSRRFQEKLKDDIVTVLFQAGDGLVLLHGDARNAALGELDLDELLAMDLKDLLVVLKERDL